MIEHMVSQCEALALIYSIKDNSNGNYSNIILIPYEGTRTHMHTHIIPVLIWFYIKKPKSYASFPSAMKFQKMSKFKEELCILAQSFTGLGPALLLPCCNTTEQI